MNQNRRNEIIRLLSGNQGLSVRQLATSFDVSEMTIRRDIRVLKEKGIVRNVSGAVLLNKDFSPQIEPYSLEVHAEKHREHKMKICRKAASLIREGDIIYIDIGSTTVHIVNELTPGMGITAVCCTMNALQGLCEKKISNIYFLGGKYRPDLQMFTSSNSLNYLKGIRMTKAFISAAGVAVSGVTCVNDVEAPVKKMAMESSLQRYLLADSSKFGQITPEFFAEVKDFDAVISDSDLSVEWQKKLKDRGIPLILAD